MVPRLLIALVLLAAGMAMAAAPPQDAYAPASHAARSLDAAAGWSLFKRPWISDPSSLEGGGGLGPLYDARSCNACHAGGGGGRVAEDAIGDGMVVRLGTADAAADPTYGRQLQTHALTGFDPEAEVAFHWQAASGMREPKLDVAKRHYGDFAAPTHAALRRAPSLFGAGELESIPESEILKGTGRPAWIAGPDGQRRLGRWGWKASVPELESQIEIAFQRDFGISTAGLPGAYGECTAAETTCRAAGGREVELPDAFRRQIATYLRLLRPPGRQSQTHPGFAVFRRTGCMACHAVLKDASGAPVRAYSDLLLHDLGPGLDDGIAEGAAKSSEWRTAPLWDVAGNLAQGGLLHDGRARSIAEAVQWHGGEASQARASFNALSPKRRRLLETFLLGK